MRIEFGNALRQLQNLINGFIALLPNLVLGALVFLVAHMAALYAARFTRSLLTRTGRSRGVSLLIGRLVRYAVLAVGILVVLSSVFPSFTARDLIQALGIGGVAIGFAFKDIFQNFLAGVIILISHPFRIGDQIIVKGYEGVVEDIQTRATIVRAYDNRLIVIPNTVVFTEEVTVLTAYETRRSEHVIGIGYGVDIDRAREVILRTLGEIDVIEKDPAPEVLASEFGESTINLLVRWWSAPKRGNLLHVRDAVLTALQKSLNREGIDLPYPTRTIFLQDQTPPRSDIRTAS